MALFTVAAHGTGGEGNVHAARVDLVGLGNFGKKKKGAVISLGLDKLNVQHCYRHSRLVVPQEAVAGLLVEAEELRVIGKGFGLQLASRMVSCKDESHHLAALPLGGLVLAERLALPRVLDLHRVLQGVTLEVGVGEEAACGGGCFR